MLRTSSRVALGLLLVASVHCGEEASSRLGSGSEDNPPVEDAGVRARPDSATSQESGPTPSPVEAGVALDGGSESDAAVDNTLPIRYFVLPHPDDEVESWSLVDSAHYPVFLLLTRGEQSKYCDGSGLDLAVGERAPMPAGFGGKWSVACTRQRLDSFDYFFSAMSPTLNLGAATNLGTRSGATSPSVNPARCDGEPEVCTSSTQFEVRVGAKYAQFIFDLGDGDLSKDEVLWAIQTARAFKPLLGSRGEADLVAAGYRNANPAFGFVYDHPDHRAIHEAVFQNDLGLPRWGRTAPNDPDAVYRPEILQSTYQAMFALVGSGPSATRVGAHVVAYGWLADPYYIPCETGFECLFSRKQDFWRR